MDHVFAIRGGRVGSRIALAAVVVMTTIGRAHADPLVTQAATPPYTGARRTFVVPSGVRTLSVTADGGAGGQGYQSASEGLGGPGGIAGEVSAMIPVTPGETLRIAVGGRGEDATAQIQNINTKNSDRDNKTR